MSKKKAASNKKAGKGAEEDDWDLILEAELAAKGPSVDATPQLDETATSKPV